MNINKKYSSGWDVGGAHLKAVLLDTQGRVLKAVQVPCALWQGLDKLDQAVDQVLADIGKADMRHAVTMTGELADIFSGRKEGVLSISTMMRQKLGAETLFYAAEHGMVGCENVAALNERIASANWHASASLVARRILQGVFVDIGSTTADIIPFSSGRLRNHGFSDAERMRADELVYTGVVRTPLMAIAQTIAFRGHRYRIAAEHFAATADVYRITGELMETEDMAPTADGAAKTCEASMRRLARMIGHDFEDAEAHDWRELADAFRAAQLAILEQALNGVMSREALLPSVPLIGAGAGSFLVQALAKKLEREYVPAESLIQTGSEAHRRRAALCFPAYAVAARLP